MRSVWHNRALHFLPFHKKNMSSEITINPDDVQIETGWKTALYDALQQEKAAASAKFKPA